MCLDLRHNVNGSSILFLFLQRVKLLESVKRERQRLEVVLGEERGLKSALEDDVAAAREVRPLTTRNRPWLLDAETRLCARRLDTSYRAGVRAARHKSTR